MELNADLAQRALVHSASAPWVPSPMAGVDRRMLDRIGGEVARATSIVRYAPRSRFSAHVHEGGEEFLVLQGVFQDEHGDYPPGTYVRNPPGSSHTPGSEQGCIIFVKLRQFAPDDQTSLRINTAEGTYRPCSAREGVAVMPLFRYGDEDVRLESYMAHARVCIPVSGGIELLVLGGTLKVQGNELTTGSWLRLPADERFEADAGPAGAKVWIKTGHLGN